MDFKSELIEGRLIKRYKRFLADVELSDGSIVVAHCANSGSMLGLKDEGARVYLSPNTNPKAKLDYRWELIEADGVLVGINTSHPNGIVEEAIKSGNIKELCGYPNLKREVKYGQNSRIDILLSSSENTDLVYVEVKSVTLKVGGMALFPDSVTARGTKHLLELSAMVKQGHRAVMVYLVQRNDCDAFGVAADIDPLYAKTLKQVLKDGVEAVCYQCNVTPKGIYIKDPLSIQI